MGKLKRNFKISIALTLTTLALFGLGFVTGNFVVIVIAFVFLAIGAISIKLLNYYTNIKYGYKEYKNGELKFNVFSKKNVKETFTKKGSRKGWFANLWYYSNYLNLLGKVLGLVFSITMPSGTSKSTNIIVRIIQVGVAMFTMLFLRENFGI